MKNSSGNDQQGQRKQELTPKGLAICKAVRSLAEALEKEMKEEEVL